MEKIWVGFLKILSKFFKLLCCGLPASREVFGDVEGDIFYILFGAFLFTTLLFILSIEMIFQTDDHVVCKIQILENEAVIHRPDGEP